MKKTAIYSSLLLSTVILASVGGTKALAAPQGEMSTDTHIEFSGHTPNPNPEGDLNLIWVPTTFEFGNHDVADNATASTSYEMQNPLPKYTVVEDKRTDAHGQWTVKAASSELKSGSNSLAGAQINITNTAVKQYTPTDNTVVPESTGAIVDAPGSWSNVTVSSNIQLAAGGAAQEVMTATGSAVENGKYAAEFGNVTLQVPQSQAKEGNYTGTVTWTLEDTL
ncbi:WxL domain-containing protein [Enterococcus sp. DIV0242_7C1]|uniref:WxL domain-containing protein n=2 Tax=Enterococcus TaxID=1350 RepID=A0A200J0C9_9ENTE|nr:MULTISPECIES: WxL domain-containing protein [Enterococcus]MBO0470342.1 WxL domain-containing protein [Enterococcus sp. DIV0242_7C1]MCA5014238.1 WxL domain-containing protein [Enterococcus sp. S23]MCA5017541.1 WxL domain-containing protein [Enterococcus sp. S22(2020)]OUZ30289.1 hypothetical protein A5889_002577 [Enterococcus sp. 9D6_DIV0238]GGC95360.1 cell surface protein [Enterococcus wangshanyuanii]